jgi:hypothetical protein
MSPLDEIRYINKLAAKKGGKKNLSRYQKWVLGGCKGKNPAVWRKIKKGGGLRCPKTKPSVAELAEMFNDVGFALSSASSMVNNAIKQLDDFEAQLLRRKKKKGKAR